MKVITLKEWTKNFYRKKYKLRIPFMKARRRGMSERVAMQIIRHVFRQELLIKQELKRLKL